MRILALTFLSIVLLAPGGAWAAKQNSTSAVAIKCDDGTGPWTTSTRIQAEFIVDGVSKMLHFASPYDMLVWLRAQEKKGKQPGWPRQAAMLDFATRNNAEPRMVDLPLGQLERAPDGTLALGRQDGDPPAAYGPWLVNTAAFIEGSFWPRYLLFADLAAAGKAAADYNGELYHWDKGLVQLAAMSGLLGSTSGGGGTSSPDIVMPDQAPVEPPQPAVIPGGEDVLK